jgi:hypothetical protein
MEEVVGAPADLQKKAGKQIIKNINTTMAGLTSQS